MDNLEKKLKEDWENLSVPDKKVLAAIQLGIKKAPKRKIPYKKIGLSVSAIAAVFVFYMYQKNTHQDIVSTAPKQETSYQEQLEEKANNDALPSQNEAVKKEAMPPSEDGSDHLTNRKITTQFSIEMESKQYDQSLTTIETQIKAAKGYIEYAYNYHDNDEASVTKENRYTRFSIKIPKDALDAFVQKISDAGNILIKEENSLDITAEYKDIETRIKNLKIQEERLQKLLGEAANLSDMLQIESRLSEIGYQLESYENQLKNFNQEVDYATVNLLLTDVTSYQNQTSLTARIKEGWVEMTNQLKNTTSDVLVWLAVHSVYLLILCLSGWIIYRKIKKLKQAK